jgi:hypothetical protein
MVHRRAVVAELRKAFPEAVHVIDRVVHADAHRDRRYRDRHHVERNFQPAHQTQHCEGRDEGRNLPDQGELQGSEEHDEHQECRDHRQAERLDLRVEQALQHVVVQHEHAGDAHLFRLEAEFADEAFAHLVQEFAADEVRICLADAQ